MNVWPWMGVLFSILISACMVSIGSAKAYMDIKITHNPQQQASFFSDQGVQTITDNSKHEIRFVSNKTVYIESLVDGQWANRYWATDGKIPFSYWRHKHSSFVLGIKTKPDAEELKLDKGWTFLDAKELERTDRGSRHFVVSLFNEQVDISVKVHTLIDGTPVLVRWLDITNNRSDPVALTTLAIWSAQLWDEPMLGPLGPFSVSTSLPWMSFAWKKLENGKTVVASEQANWYDDPFFMVRNESNGEYFIGHLGWTANYRIRFDCEMERRQSGTGLTFEIGPRSKDALRVIAANETITSPAVHLGHLAGDLDETVQAMHEHIRRSVLAKRNPQRAGLIQVNTPGDQGYYIKSFNEENVKKCIDVAAAIGAELFLLDCPWYDHYGEWVPSPRRFPNGLKPLVDYTHQKGMYFGLQTEVEGGRGDWSQSPVKQNHPDWFGDQNIMRLDLPEPARYMEEELARVFDEYRPDLYRNEFIPNNSQLPRTKPDAPGFTVEEWISVEQSGFRENRFWRYYDAWNNVFETIRKKYPDIVLQQCANCGTREDLGTISRFDETNTAEGPVENMIGIIAGKTLCIPPEVIAMGYGTAKERGPLDTFLRAQYTLMTPQFVTPVGPDVAETGPVVIERCRHYSKLYKKFIRPIMPTSKVFHHNPAFTTGDNPWGDPWFAMEYAAPDGAKGWATIIKRSHTEQNEYIFKPRGLRRDRKYKVTFDRTGETIVVDGFTLTQQGISIRLASVMSSELLLFENE